MLIVFYMPFCILRENKDHFFARGEKYIPNFRRERKLYVMCIKLCNSGIREGLIQFIKKNRSKITRVFLSDR